VVRVRTERKVKGKVMSNFSSGWDESSGMFKQVTSDLRLPRKKTEDI
jgi:hypothetical protein